MYLCESGDGCSNREPGVGAARAIGVQLKFGLHRKVGGGACKRSERRGLIDIVLLFEAAPRRGSYQRDAFAGRRTAKCGEHAQRRQRGQC